MTDIKHPSELKFVFETHFRQFAGCYSGSCCSTSIVVGRTKQKAAWIIEMSSFLAGCHVLSPWLVVSNVSFPTVPEDDDTQWLFCATTNQTECILFDAVVVGYIMSILSSISFGSNPMIPPHKQLYCQHVVLGVCCCLHIPPPALLSVFIQCALLVNCCLRSYPAFAGCKPMCLLAKPQLALSVFTQLLLVETPSLLLMSLICVGCFTMCCWLKPE